MCYAEAPRREQPTSQSGRENDARRARRVRATACILGKIVPEAWGLSRDFPVFVVIQRNWHPLSVPHNQINQRYITYFTFLHEFKRKFVSRRNASPSVKFEMLGSIGWRHFNSIVRYWLHRF